MEYISREAAIKAILDLRDCYNGFSDTYDKACIIGALDEIPAADVRPVVRGKWEESIGPGISGCSNCHDCYIDTAWAKGGKWHYCPNCGASMEVEHD